VIVPHDQICGEVRELYESGGLPKGASSGWATVDDLYTVGQGQWTLLTGMPGSGKSEWLDALMVNLASKEPWRFVIYSPENWPLAMHYAKVIEKFSGKPFGKGPNERLSQDELTKAMDWMKGKFIFAKPEHSTMADILNEANKFAMPGGDWGKKLGVVIDPWNQLEHYRPQGMSETEYVSQTLSEVIRWTRERMCHLWLVAHPAKLQRNKDGKLPIPTPHDVAGSAHFWNKADNCITVWRDQSDYQKQDVDIHVQKIRFKNIGRIGVTTLKYDRVTGRYNETPRAEVIDMKTRSAGVQDF
jgi:twinkle protein